MILDQSTFEYLKNLPKTFITNEPLEVSSAPQKWTRKLQAVDTADTFLIDFYRGKLNLAKFTINSRYQGSIVLARLDSRGTHKNPDGKIIQGPHIHIYQQDYGEKFAYSLSTHGFKEPIPSIKHTIVEFLAFFNVTHIPEIK